MKSYLRGLITRVQYNEVRSKDLESPRRIGAYLVTTNPSRPESGARR